MLSRRRLILLVALGASVTGGMAYFTWVFKSSSSTLAAAEEAYLRGDWSIATAKARSLLKSEPGNITALRLAARAAARQGDDVRSESLYRRVGTSNMQPEDFFLLGRGLIQRGRVGPGRAALGAALDINPDHAETLDALLTFATEGSSLLKAAAHAERLSRQPGWETRGTIALARIRHDLLQPAAAAELLIQALNRDPELAHAKADTREVRLLLARCLLETGQTERAHKELDKSLAAGTDARASWLLSRALLMEGKLAEARAALEESQRAETSDPLRAEPAPFVGAARCASCHPKEFKTQQISNHANTLRARSQLTDLPWPERPLIDLNNPRVTHEFQKAENAVEVQTRVGNEVFAAIVEYAMGSNHQGRSFVGHDRQGQARELRVSEYPSAPPWSRTSEHPEEPPDPVGYLGRPIGDEAVRKCVHCHSTNVQAVQEPAGRPEAGDHGIGCERCHGPGGHHVRAVEERFPDLAIARPRLATAERVVALCGQCHKAPDQGSPKTPSFIRFQAPTLVQSRCYTESGTLSCVTCHNPHRNASRTPADYETVCLQCHPSPSHRRTTGKLQADQPKTWASCASGGERDCLNCHMPRIPEAVSRAVFTDHYIRIRDDHRSP